MALSTSTGSLAVGASRAFNLSPGSALTLVAPPNCRVTVTETPNTVNASGVGGNASRVHNLQLGQTVTYGPYPMGGTVVVANASNSGTAITWVRSDAIVAESASGSVSLVDGGGNLFLPSAHPKYHFMGSARAQTADETVFRDLVNTNNGVFGTHLSAANAWANIASGYVSTLNPAGAAEESCIRIPAPSFDMQSGEALLIFWSGVVTPEGSDVGFMGTSIASSASGVRIQVKSSGGVATTLYDGAGNSSFGPTSAGAFVTSTLTNFAIWLDGQGEWIAQWVNGSIAHSQAIVKRNTLSADTFGIGKATPNAVSTDGIASKTLAFHMLKWGENDAKPSIAKLSAAVSALNRNPLSAIAAGAL